MLLELKEKVMKEDEFYKIQFTEFLRLETEEEICIGFLFEELVYIPKQVEERNMIYSTIPYEEIKQIDTDKITIKRLELDRRAKETYLLPLKLKDIDFRKDITYPVSSNASVNIDRDNIISISKDTFCLDRLITDVYYVATKTEMYVFRKYTFYDFVFMTYGKTDEIQEGDYIIYSRRIKNKSTTGITDVEDLFGFLKY